MLSSDATPRLPFTHSAEYYRYNDENSATHSAETNWYNDGGVAVHSAETHWYNECGVAVESAEVRCDNEGALITHSAQANLYNEGQYTSNVTTQLQNNERQLIRQPRHRANSSISTISMSCVPEFMSAGQLLSPRGLSATSRLFNQPDTSDSAKVYALRGEEINVGLGLTNVNVLDGLVECEDIYQFAHSEDDGGIPVRKAKKGGKKRRRDVNDVDGDVDGDFVAISRYHLDFEDESSSDDNSEGVAQGGVLLEEPFPAFGKLCLIPCEGR